MEKWEKNREILSTIKKIKIALKHVKIYATSLRREIQVKAMKRYHFPSQIGTHQNVR